MHDCLMRKPQGIYQNLLELISEFSNVVCYKINIQKTNTFLHTKKKKDVEAIIKAQYYS